MGQQGDARGVDMATADWKGVVASTFVCGVLGFVLGFATWVLLNVAYTMTDVVWEPITSGELPVWIVPVVCAAGGALLGWWNKRFKSAPEPFAKVIKDAMANGGYSIKRPVASFVSFLLPLAFGGPVGPEAGLTGVIAAGCTRIGSALHRVRLTVCGVASALTRRQKYLVYGVGVVGGALGVAAYSSLFGGMGLPRFAVPEFSVQAVLWLIPLTLAGMALSGLMRFGSKVFGDLSRRFARYEVARAALCGLALGVIALGLPYVLFPGTEQLSELIEAVSSLGAVELGLTSIAKMLMLTLCLAMGWSGGPFFPLIFSASALALSISLIAGIDAGLCLTVVTAALLGRFTRKIGMAAGILLICVPLPGMLWAVIPLAAGAMLPTIEELAARGREAQA